MSATVVKTQAELDAAVSAGAEWIRIESPRGVWLNVATPRSTEVEASGSASVRASGSASVSAYGSASVSAYGSASVSAYGSASVSASGSASVSAYGSASVSAYGSASVSASDSASVRASDSASVRASGSASVSAYGSASVSAYGSSSISLHHRAKVEADPRVAVHLHSGTAQVQGGVVIDHTDVDLDDVATWLGYNGITVVDGIATFYKAVDSELNAGHLYRLTQYPIGETVTAPDWDPAAVCGGGLHATGDPLRSEAYYNGPNGVRYLELAVPVAGLVLLDDKVKFESCTVVREVTVSGAAVVR